MPDGRIYVDEPIPVYPGTPAGQIKRFDPNVRRNQTEGRGTPVFLKHEDPTTMRMNEYLLLAGLVLLSGCEQASVARKNSNTDLPQVRPAEKNLQEMAVDSSSDEVAS